MELAQCSGESLDSGVRRPRDPSFPTTMPAGTLDEVLGFLVCLSVK